MQVQLVAIVVGEVVVVVVVVKMSPCWMGRKGKGGVGGDEG